MQNMEQMEADFTTQLNPGNLKDAMKAAGASSGDLWKVPLSQIRLIEGLNVRPEDEEYWAYIEELAYSMEAEGYYLNKPMAGFIQRDAGTGESYISIYDGHTRMRAITIANKRLAAQSRPLIDEVTVTTQTKDKKPISKVDIYVAMVQGNKARPFGPYSCAIMCQRLAAENVPVAEIARRLGFSTEWVNSLLLLMSAPEELRRRVSKNELTVTLAVQLLKAYGDDAAEMVEDAAASKVAEGKAVKITLKNVKPANPFTKAVKRSAPAMFDALANVRKDPAFAKLNADTREKLIELMETLEKVKDEVAIDHPKQTTIFDAADGAA